MSALRAWLAAGNALLLAGAALLVVAASGPLAGYRVGPLIAGGSPLVQRQLVELQREVLRSPGDPEPALALARLLIRVGERAQAREVLGRFEQRIVPEPLLQLACVAAYVELGWPTEALRLLRSALARCQATAACTSGDEARLRLALQAGEVMLRPRDSVAPAGQDGAPADVWRQVLKPALAAPARPQPEQANGAVQRP